MSSTENLLVHLRLNRIIEENGERKVIDENGREYPVIGNPQVVEDEELGNCIRFDGSQSYINLGTVGKGISNQITTQAWINPDILETEGYKAPILSSHFPGGWELRGGEKPAMMVKVDGGFEETFSSDSIKTGEWVHLAGTYDGSEVKIYLNGQLKGNISATGNITEGSEEAKIAISPNLDLMSERQFQGKIASVRLYNRALSAEEIQRDMEEDRFSSVDPPFRSSYPIGFDLYDDDDQNFLHIDSEPTNLHFSVFNVSRETVAFSLLSGEPSKENYHLELKFRPGSLANWEQITLAESDPWNFKAEENPDKTISLYFLSTGTPEMAPQGQLDLTLQKVSADGSGGARGTRVELKYRNLKYKSAPEAEKLEGTRVEHLSIVNQQGNQDIPLYVGFVGSNNVINDGGCENELYLRIANASSDPISLGPSSGAVPKFILSFDSGDATSKPWALGTDSQVEGINVQVKFPEGDWQEVTKSGQGSSVQWEIDIPASLSQLDGQNYLQVKLSNIITDHPSGFTKLYVRYQNIPGYWDGEFVSEIEKAPLLYADYGSSTDRNVGIGTNNPRGKLHVSGDYYGKGHIWLHAFEGENQSGTAYIQARDQYEGTSIDLQFRVQETGELVEAVRIASNGNVGIGTTDVGSAKLKIAGSELSDFAQFVMDSDGMGKLEIGGWEEGWNIQTMTANKHLHLNRDSEASSNVYIGCAEKELFVRGEDGNVGIGTKNLKGKLHVNGDYYGKGHIFLHAFDGDGKDGTAYIQARDDSGSSSIGLQLRSQDNGTPTDAVMIDSNGNVGVGTTNPQAKLHIQGGLRIGDTEIGETALKVLKQLANDGLHVWIVNEHFDGRKLYAKKTLLAYDRDVVAGAPGDSRDHWILRPINY